MICTGLGQVSLYDRAVGNKMLIGNHTIMPIGVSEPQYKRNYLY